MTEKEMLLYIIKTKNCKDISCSGADYGRNDIFCPGYDRGTITERRCKYALPPEIKENPSGDITLNNTTAVTDFIRLYSKEELMEALL